MTELVELQVQVEGSEDIIVLNLSAGQSQRAEKSNHDLSVKDMVKDINGQIRPFQQNVKLTTDEVTEEQVLVFLSLGFDDITKSQNLFSTAELEYFRVLIEQIVTTERRQVSGMAALNLVNRLKVVLTKQDAERYLKSWCELRYLDAMEGSYSLGVRAVHEFEGYMRRNLPDAVQECTLCKQIVFRGCNCPLCGLAVHTRCLNRYLERIQSWPCCKGEYAGLPDISHLTQELSQGPGPSVSPVYDPHQLDEATQEMEESAEECTQAGELGISQSSAVRRRKRRRE